MEALNGSDRPEARRLGLRLTNLGVDRYTVWARGEAGSVLDAVHDESVRCVVVDLGSLPTARSSPWSPRWCWAICGAGVPNAARY